GIDGFNRKISKKDLMRDSRYNTYRYRGLPPGPICNPGKDSIIAALWPAKTDYLYFVARGDGRHYFSVTLKQHLRAVAKVRRNRRR
ncbi:MAG: endolytic transglycosylase MltG, partial [Deltaproteobacteria bacterium]|nr:endolytic transglycosylase MltG [Deltaproteobacteria bacterium]